MPGLETKNLTFSYGGGGGSGDKNIIEDVTCAFAHGEAWAVIGRNGAGKSTLLKCLCGLLKPGVKSKSQRQHKNQSQSQILINGKNISELTPRELALQIAYVPQSVNRQAPPFTVREYVMMARFPHRGFLSTPDKKDKDSVDAALALTGAGHLAGRVMNALSGGEFRSALIAGAVAQGAPFLLLDEPTAYLDPYHHENIRRLIGRVHAELGTAVVTVTHDVNFALSVHGNILALVEGRAAFCGTREEFCVDAEKNLSKIFSVDFREAGSLSGQTFYAPR